MQIGTPTIRRSASCICCSDKAVVWLKSLKENEDCDKDNWNSVMKAFLLHYEPRITSKTTCTNLADMAQWLGQVANRHYLRLFATFNNLQENYPAKREAIKLAPALADAATAAEQIKITRRFWGCLLIHETPAILSWTKRSAQDWSHEGQQAHYHHLKELCNGVGGHKPKLHSHAPHQRTLKRMPLPLATKKANWRWSAIASAIHRSDLTSKGHTATMAATAMVTATVSAAGTTKRRATCRESSTNAAATTRPWSAPTVSHARRKENQFKLVLGSVGPPQLSLSWKTRYQKFENFLINRWVPENDNC